MKNVCFIILSLFFVENVNAQSVAINTTGTTANASSILDISSTTKGLLIPRLTKAQKNAIATPATGLLIFQTAPDSIGFQYFDGSNWLWLQAAEDAYWAKNGNNIYNRNIGKVGIGTTNPLARLHLIDTIQFGVLFTGSKNETTIVEGTTPVIGTGARLMWLPKQAAFRAGAIMPFYNIFGVLTVDTTVWDNLNVGAYSTAFGLNSKAKGTASLSIGFNTSASGDYSTAMGFGTIASGDGSTAMGFGTIASGDGSTAIGRVNIAKGYSSTVVGMYNDTILSAPQTAVTPQTPLFIVGNGSTASTRSNALVVQKNGNIGVNISTPNYGLHVVSDLAGDGSFVKGIMIENTAPYANAGEAAISFRNIAITPNKKWTLGINQTNTDLAIFYGTEFHTNIDSTRFSIDTTGNVGLSSTSNDVRLQIGGAIAFERQTFSANLVTTNITVGNRTYLRINSDDPNPANRKVTLTNGLVIGQMIIIQCLSNSFRLEDTDVNLELQGTADYNMSTDDTITLIWDGNEWVELNRSNN